MPDPIVVLPNSLIQQIAVDQIRSSRYQARKAFDEEGIKGLADSIKHEGLLQSITVRQVEGGYELVSGERRLMAVKLLGLPTIEAKIIQPVSEAEAAAKGLVENLQRKNLNPIEEGEGFQTLNHLDPVYWSHDEIAEIMGKDRSYVTKSISLLGLPENIKVYVRRRTLNRSNALELLGLTTQELQIEAADQMVAGKSIKQIRALFEGAKKRKGKKVEAALEQTNGPPTSFPEGSHGESPHSSLTADDLMGPLPATAGDDGEKKTSQINASPSDPLAGLWDEIRQTIPADVEASWEATYEGSLSWLLRIRVPDSQGGTIESMRRSLSTLFTSLGKAVDSKDKPIQAVRTEVPIPKIRQASYISGNKLKITWASVGEGYTYRLFKSYGAGTVPEKPVADGKTVSTAGAVVDIYAGGNSACMIAVMAIDPQGLESELSQPVQFDLKPWNNDNTVEPLPLA